MSNPQYLRSCIVMVSDVDALRVHRLIRRLGSVKAAVVALGLGYETVEEARGQGRMMRTTRDRLRAALDREEAAA